MPGWFDAVGRDDLETVFLDVLRERAAEWRIPGLRPEATSVVAAAGYLPLVVLVAVPGLEALGSRGLSTLQVGWTSGGPGMPGRLEGEWGDDHLLDSGRGGPGDRLEVTGLRESPAEIAHRTAAWLEAQLLRRRRRSEWLRRGRCVASTVRLDGGLVLGSSGRSIRRLLGRPPDRVSDW